jgi:Xaa-Pro aminopeptidase
MASSSDKLALLRAAMKEKAIDVYLLLSTDPHLGEYIPDHWRIISWLIGFTGSAASVLVTESFAGLWTDSRYYIQARSQLQGSGFQLMLPSLNEIKDYTGWLESNLTDGAALAVDGRTISIAGLRRIERLLAGKKIIYNTHDDLISGIWEDRPPMPLSVAFDLPVIYSGKERESKIAEVRSIMKKRDTGYQLLTSTDDIMWLLNIRGNDIRYSPLLICFAIVGEEQILLFIDEDKIPYKLAAEFDRSGIVILPYEETAAVLSTLPAGHSILINPLTTSAGLFNSIPPGMRIIEELTIPSLLKSVKNRVEIENIGRAMIKDGIALTRFFFWLENESETESLTELSLADKLLSFRAEQEDFLGPSFSSIIAFGEHGALPHYTATADTDSKIGQEGILLIDSGGQYLNGTTDITRTIALGRPTAKQVKDFTLVLKGNIGLAMAKVPAGTRGIQLDILARKALWEYGLNYGHGTGHGVGFCLNVHEGPQSISPSESAGSKTIIEPGMLISDEPAIYREGEYGIRIENLILCYEDEESEFGRFLRFDTMSLCYIDRSLIDVSLLEKKEIAWLNSYHSLVYEKLSPLLTEAGKEWLKEKTAAV